MVVVGLSNGIRVGFEYALHFELHLAAPLITSIAFNHFCPQRHGCALHPHLEIGGILILLQLHLLWAMNSLATFCIGVGILCLRWILTD